MTDSVEALEGTGWRIGVDQNPITGKWHWIIFQGPASFTDKQFIEAYNAGLTQTAESREGAIAMATQAALDKHAGWIEEPLFDTSEQPLVDPNG